MIHSPNFKYSYFKYSNCISQQLISILNLTFNFSTLSRHLSSACWSEGREVFFFFSNYSAIVQRFHCEYVRAQGNVVGQVAVWCYLGRRLSSPWQRRAPVGAGAVAHCVVIREIPKIHNTQRKWPDLTRPSWGGFSEADRARWNQTGQDICQKWQASTLGCLCLCSSSLSIFRCCLWNPISVSITGL